MTGSTQGAALAGQGKAGTGRKPAKGSYSGSGQKPADKPGKSQVTRKSRWRTSQDQEDGEAIGLPAGEGDDGFDLGDQGLIAVEVLRSIMNDSRSMPVERIAAARAVAQIEMRGGAGSGGAVSRLSRDEICAEIARTRQAIDANTLKS